MSQPGETVIIPDTVLTGPFWPGPVRVIRVEAVGATRIKIEAVSLDGEERLITRLLRREDLTQVQTVSDVGQADFGGDALNFRLAHTSRAGEG